MRNGPQSAPAPDAWRRADSPETTASPELTTDFVGRRWPVFWLALKTGVLTVLTLGIYRFWQKTRLRRWYWSAIRLGGQPLEYVGDPIEKMLGFLIAVVILAFYIGIVNLLLMFVSFSLFQSNAIAYLLSFIGVIPLWFYARYRARRYTLARTRWRGLRFGLEAGAWGYAARALWYWTLTLVTVGALLPRMTFLLEKYKTDRTSYGTARMRQGGRWQMLYPAMKPLFAAVGLAVLAVVIDLAGNTPLAIGMGILAAMLGLYGLIHYRVTTLRLLTGTKTLEGVGLTLSASPLRISMIYALGYVLTSVVILFPLIVLGMLGLAIFGLTQQLDLDVARRAAALPQWALLGLAAMAYFTVFLLWSALSHAFVTMPVIRHYARGLRLQNPAALTRIRQRPRDEVQQAEGFAEALDVGASI